MRKSMIIALTGFAVLMLGASAGAAPNFSLVWTGTSGTGVTGASSISAVSGDTLTVDVLLDPAGETTTTGWDFSLFGTNVLGVSGQECPLGSTEGSLSNFINGSCFTGAGSTQPIQAGVTVTGSDVIQFDNATLTPAGYTGQSVWIGRAVFEVTGVPGEVMADGLYGFGDFSQTAWTATATIVPEPGTIGLMGIGLAVLGLAGRRRD